MYYRYHIVDYFQERFFPKKQGEKLPFSGKKKAIQQGILFFFVNKGSNGPWDWKKTCPNGIKHRCLLLATTIYPIPLLKAGKLAVAKSPAPPVVRPINRRKRM